MVSPLAVVFVILDIHVGPLPTSLVRLCKVAMVFDTSTHTYIYSTYN